MRGKSLCIVDTSSLINSCEVELGQKSLDKWLWEEFEVKYSRVVLDEFQRGKSKGNSRRKWEDHVWPLSTIGSNEQILFKSPQREIEYPCRRCMRIISRDESFKIDFADTRDRGERHNCCVALDAVSAGKYPQVIFLIDDFRAVRDYARYFFNVFPLGNIWSLLDFITYLFMRHHKRIALADAKIALQNANAQSNIAWNARGSESERQLQRLNIYLKKVEHIAYVHSQISGGRP